MLEHFSFTVRFISDRGVSHEIVRHRIASFSQESTRYCNYSNGKFNKKITFIIPSFLYGHENGYEFELWKKSCEQAEDTYFKMLENGCRPQEARAVLPNSLKTEIVMTANLREWRHFLRLRTSPAAHPDIKVLIIPLLKELQSKIPVVFDDILVSEDNA